MGALRWVRPEDGRYYRVTLQRDLFGRLELRCTWGSLNSNRGGGQVLPFDSATTARTAMRAIGRTRRQHGYHFQPSGTR